VLKGIRMKRALKLVKKLGITKEMIEERKKEFLAWLSERGLQPSWENYVAFIKDTKGQANLIDWVIGVILLAILGVGVALPIVINTIQSILPNLSGTTAMIVGIIPTIVTVVLLLMFLGRR